MMKINPNASRFSIAAFILGAFVLMGGQCNPTTPPGTDLKDGAMSADFADGTSFLSTAAKANDAGSEVDLLAIQDVAGSPADEIALKIPKQILLPYTVTMPNTTGDVTTLVEYCQTVGASCRQFYARAGQGSCTITVTQLKPTVKGSFQATTIQAGTADSIRTITSGDFNAIYQ